ncbi:MAG: tRNA uridine-5-carboxymethylaminomethyl(34) synthesis GTPase MnmE [Anaerolineae bacterium]
MDDTIAAIATPLGMGGIGIVRLSGPEALAIARRVFRVHGRAVPVHPASHRLYHGHVVEPDSGRVVDEALLSYMRAPHSYTGEDVVEISVHGGAQPVRETLAVCLAQGARQAREGEFTLRAFLNGRLDLSQAEAVLDVIESRTRRALQVAETQLAGGLSREIRDLRARLLVLLAGIEATIDFPEDVEPTDIEPELRAVHERLDWLLAEAERGIVYRQGVRTAIVGRPNVGKSSLLNALLRTERAIVTPVPGTTRDTLEEVLNLQGVPLLLVDTAGLADTTDPVERIGVERTRRALAQADLAIVVYDGSVPPDEEDRNVAELAAGTRSVVVLNKVDLGSAEGYDALIPEAVRVAVSALTGAGLDLLESALLEATLGGADTGGDPLASNPRHRDLLRRAAASLDDLSSALGRGESLDLLTIDLSEALAALGEITGEQASEELLHTIFSRFCIGK